MIELTNKLKANTSTTETITLAFDERQRSRYKSQLDSGEEAWIILVGSARGGILRSGDVLKSTDGRAVKVQAKPEPLMETRSDNANLLARAAYHLGNRHAHVEVTANTLRFERDHVYAEMLQGLGLEVQEVVAPFEPEQGAYAAGHAGHSHSDDAKHAGRIHDKNDGTLQYAAVPITIIPDPTQNKQDKKPHVHGPGCGHDH
jgi:urease accessory protein